MELKNEKGFTLIELLVVIAIISILASMLFVAINPAEQSNKANAIKIINDLKIIKESFSLTALEKGRETYPNELDIPGSKMIHNMINNGELIKLPKNLKPNELGNNYYGYDNDKDVYDYLNNCPGANTPKGANIYVTNLNSGDLKIVNKIDELFDDGNGLNCGKIRTYQNYLMYSLDDNK